MGALKIWVEETSTNRDERILAAPRKYSSSHSDMCKRTVDAPILELLKTPDEAMRQICIRRLIEVCCGPHAMNARGERASACVKRSTRARLTCSSFCNRSSAAVAAAAAAAATVGVRAGQILTANVYNALPRARDSTCISIVPPLRITDLYFVNNYYIKNNHPRCSPNTNT